MNKIKKFFFLNFLFIFLFSLTSCKKTKDNLSTLNISYFLNDEEVLYPFGTSFSFKVYDSDFTNTKGENIKEDIINMHKLFDNNHDYYQGDKKINNIKVLNDSYNTNEWIEVDQLIIEIIKEGIRFTKISEGSFNVSVGSLSSLWKRYIEENNSFNTSITTDPTIEEINKAKACVVDYKKIEEIIQIDSINNKIKINKLEGCNDKVKIDLSALAKSYTLEKIVEKYELSSKSYFINGGGSTILTNKTKPNDSNWRIMIPFSRFSNNQTRELFIVGSEKQISVSTSGGEENYYYNCDNILRHHLIDPFIGEPANYFLNVSVVTRNSFYGDMISTIFMSTPKEKLPQIIENLNKEEIEYGFVLQEKTSNTKIYMNKFFENYILESFNINYEYF